jgi:hypothetical protein
MVLFDWQRHPVIASTLLQAAKTDKSNIVRVDCLRHLAAYNMNHPQVLSDLGAMKSDSDPWVRQEVATALEKLKPVR